MLGVLYLYLGLKRLQIGAVLGLRRSDEGRREQTLSRLPSRAVAELDALLLGPNVLPGAPVGLDGVVEAPSRESEEANLYRLRADPGRASRSATAFLQDVLFPYLEAL